MKGALLAVLFILAAISADVAVAHRSSLFPWWHFNSAVKKCVHDFPRVHKCLIQIHESIENHKLNISSECCKAIEQTNDDCASTVFAKFKSPFYQLVLKQCSSAPPVEPPVSVTSSLI